MGFQRKSTVKPIIDEETGELRPTTAETRTQATSTRPATTDTQPATTDTKPSTVKTRTDTSGARLTTIETRGDMISTRATTVKTRVNTTEIPSRTSTIPPIEDATTKQSLRPDQRGVEPTFGTTDSTSTLVPPQTLPAVTREPLSKAIEVIPDIETTSPVPAGSTTAPPQSVDDTINTTRATNTTTSAAIYDTSPFSVKPTVSLFCKVFILFYFF